MVELPSQASANSDSKGDAKMPKPGAGRAIAGFPCPTSGRNVRKGGGFPPTGGIGAAQMAENRLGSFQIEGDTEGGAAKRRVIQAQFGIVAVDDVLHHS